MTASNSLKANINTELWHLKPGTCNALFYDEVNRGNIHNGKSEFLKAAQLPAFIWTMFS